MGSLSDSAGNFKSESFFECVQKHAKDYGKRQRPFGDRFTKLSPIYSGTFSTSSSVQYGKHFVPLVNFIMSIMYMSNCLLWLMEMRKWCNNLTIIMFKNIKMDKSWILIFDFFENWRILWNSRFLRNERFFRFGRFFRTGRIWQIVNSEHVLDSKGVEAPAQIKKLTELSLLQKCDTFLFFARFSHF